MAGSSAMRGFTHRSNGAGLGCEAYVKRRILAISGKSIFRPCPQRRQPIQSAVPAARRYRWMARHFPAVAQERRLPLHIRRARPRNLRKNADFPLRLLTRLRDLVDTIYQVGGIVCAACASATEIAAALAWRPQGDGFVPFANSWRPHKWRPLGLTGCRPSASKFTSHY